jgi:hypothetical protein
METLRSSETLAFIQNATQRNNPEGCIFSFFNDDFSVTYTVVSNEGMIIEWWIGKLRKGAVVSYFRSAFVWGTEESNQKPQDKRSASRVLNRTSRIRGRTLNNSTATFGATTQRMILRRVALLQQTDVSEVRTASSIRKIFQKAIIFYLPPWEPEISQPNRFLIHRFTSLPYLGALLQKLGENFGHRQNFRLEI